MCFKLSNGRYIDLILTNPKSSSMHSTSFETAHHHSVYTRGHQPFRAVGPKLCTIHYHCWRQKLAISDGLTIPSKGDQQPVSAPHEELDCVIGNLYAAAVATMTETTLFTIECHEIVQRWKNPNSLAISKHKFPSSYTQRSVNCIGKGK